MSAERKWTPKDDEVDGEEEEEDVQQYQSQKDAILFAIHVSESMLATHDDTQDPPSSPKDTDKPKSKKTTPTSAVLTALQCAYSVLQSRIISNPADMIGILLFGTATTRFTTDSGYQHCYLLLDLDIPDATGIRELKNLISDPAELSSLLAPSEEPVSMANVLFAANQIFTTKAANFQSRRLFVVTDNDDPHAKDKALRNSAITRARDLYDLGVRIEPFFIAQPGKPGGFDAARFWDDVVYRAPGEDEDAEMVVSATADGTVRLKEMVTSILSKSTAKRALFNTTMEIGPGLLIGVKGYMLYKRQEKARSHYVFTSAERAQLVTGVTTKVAAETARAVEKTEIRKAYKFGGEQVVFTQEEMKAMRYFGEPVIRILGFKPSSSLQFEHNVKPAKFIYPDESTHIGSTRTFAAMHKKLAETDKMGVVWCIARRGGPPQVCALYPSIEVVIDGVQTHPPGFFLIPIPFADDIRQNPDVPIVKAPARLIDRMRAVVKQLHMPKGYIPEKYSNPALQWHYRILQAIALDEDLPEKAPDPTLPKYKLIEKYTGAQCKEWFDELLEATAGMAVTGEKTGTKRSVVNVREGGGPAKRAKSEKPGADGGDEVESAYKTNTLNKLTVAKLKGWLDSRGLIAVGRKADLIDAVENHFESK
ncbi:SPOC like C-terminal domain-containing protein [Morchella snyderi]|nr:SPOC like C-terminal domain-containing protein [Morchella snyderi]